MKRVFKCVRPDPDLDVSWSGRRLNQADDVLNTTFIFQDISWMKVELFSGAFSTSRMGQTICHDWNPLSANVSVKLDSADEWLIKHRFTSWTRLKISVNGKFYLKSFGLQQIKPGLGCQHFILTFYKVSNSMEENKSEGRLWTLRRPELFVWLGINI